MINPSSKKHLNNIQPGVANGNSGVPGVGGESVNNNDNNNKKQSLIPSDENNGDDEDDEHHEEL